MTRWPAEVRAASLRRSLRNAALVLWVSQPSVSTTRLCIWEVEVDLEAWVVGGIEDEVPERLGQARSAHELAEGDLELAAGQVGRLAERSREGSFPSMPVVSLDHLGDGAVVVELEALGLGERSLEAVSGTVAARSRRVRATAVMGMASWLAMSRAL